ncbi:hypothetical protein [uncultured Microbacterium sp.]|uniref:hypothetical protein n=1 Tax=uncultured Microbacterium sp. TaxID=191216 RepID=UPI0025D2EE42|nr:hypothetical protein [uncultured Microbacterium sp.]
MTIAQTTPARRGRRCDVCALPAETRTKLETQLAEGMSFSRISRAHGAPSRDSLRRHVTSGHLAPDIADAVARAHGLDVVAVSGRIAEAAQRAREAGLLALEDGDAALALRAIDVETRTLAALAAAGVEREADAIVAASAMDLARALYTVARADAHVADALTAELDRRGLRDLADDVFSQFSEPKGIGS